MPDPLRNFAADQAFLQRLARSLVRDEPTADDLVQNAWLAALERPPSPGPLRTWLARVVRNRALNDARDDDRRRARERAAPPDPDSADDLEHRLALQEDVLRAVRALREPFRTAIVLRYSDGLPPTDIARRLGVPLATVKARLARARELLRADLDRRSAGQRAAWLAPLAAWAQPPAASAATLTLGTLIGTWTMKKALAIAALVAAALLLRAFLSDPASSAPEALAGNPPAELATADGATARLDAPAPAHPEERAPAPIPAPAPAALRGRVVDGRTSEPLAGVEVELHARRELTLRQLKHEERGFFFQNLDGAMITHAEWIDLPDELGFGALARDEPIAMGTRPRAGDTPLAATRSDAAGEFTLELGAGGGMLQLTHPGYGSRVLPAPAEETDQELVVELWPGGRLAGQVIDVQGEPLEQVFELRFVARQDGKLIGYQDVTTNAHGAFDVELAGKHVSPKSRTPDWRVTRSGVHPVHRQPWAFRNDFEPGNEPEPVYVPLDDARSCTTLRVVDDATDRPIEDFWLLVRDESRESVRECGRFYAPHGEFPLEQHVDQAGAWIRDYLEQTHGSATVWTEQHAPTTVAFTNLLAGELREVRLKKGAGTSSVAGRVVDAGRPLADVEVTLRPFLKSLHRYLDDSRRLDVARTGADGFFVLGGPAGTFTIQANHAGEYRQLEVTLPAPDDVLLDFAEACAFELTLRDRHGAPCADFPLFVNAGGKQIGSRTDEHGFVRIVPLEPGVKQIYLAYGPYPGSYVADEVREITLLPRQTLHEEWVLPIPAEPVYARLSVDGWEGPFAGWRALDGTRGGAEWVEVEPDGTIPIDVQRGNLSLHVEGAGHEWRRGVWGPPGPDPTIHLALVGPGYTGIVRRTSGEPFRGLRVFATPLDGSIDLTSSAVTDREGRFQLVGLEPVPHLLEFHTSARAEAREIAPNPLVAVLFEASAQASDPPAQLELTLPERQGTTYPDFDTVRFTGRVSDAAGIAQPGARVDVVSLYPQPQGTLLVGAYSWKTADENGAYTEEVPRAPRYRASVYVDGAQASARIEWEDEGAAAEVRRDLVLDPD